MSTRGPVTSMPWSCPNDRIQSGLSSGEGLIWAVRDPITKTEPVMDGKRRTGEYEEVVVDPEIGLHVRPNLR